jgi:hypothetical protein
MDILVDFEPSIKIGFVDALAVPSVRGMSKIGRGFAFSGGFGRG